MLFFLTNKLVTVWISVSSSTLTCSTEFFSSGSCCRFPVFNNVVHPFLKYCKYNFFMELIANISSLIQWGGLHSICFQKISICQPFGFNVVCIGVFLKRLFFKNILLKTLSGEQVEINFKKYKQSFLNPKYPFLLNEVRNIVYLRHVRFLIISESNKVFIKWTYSAVCITSAGRCYRGFHCCSNCCPKYLSSKGNMHFCKRFGVV